MSKINKKLYCQKLIGNSGIELIRNFAVKIDKKFCCQNW